MRYKNKIAYIIPTKDRPQDLVKLFESILRQTYKPDQIIVVDGGDDSIKHLLDRYTNLKIDYTIVRPPGLTKQRNVGVSLLKGDITLVGFLDDDIILENDATEKMLIFWETARQDIGGTAFNIKNNIKTPFSLFRYIFGLNNGRQGTITKAGCNVILNPVNKDTQVEWLCGGATVWRKEVLDKYKFDESITGFGYYDDIDYSLRVGQKHTLFVLANAKVEHFPHSNDKTRSFKINKYNVMNRYILVKKHRQLSLLFFYWSVIGIILGNIFKGLIRLKKEEFNKAFGSISGLLFIFFNKNIKTKC